MATSEVALAQELRAREARETVRRSPRLDVFLLIGIAIAFGAALIGLRSTGVDITYFLQPTGAVMVLGGTFGVMLITTPRHALIHSLRRVATLASASDTDRAALIDEIVEYARHARRGGLLGLEPMLPRVRNPLLGHALELAVDISNHGELRSVLETELHMAERQGEADAKTLEVAGGFAPTLGIVGTVVGLIEVLRGFSNLSSVGYGIGTAFVSTIYGLALANLFLLPLAHRIRARVTENFETQELILEGVLSIADSVHPSVIRMRLVSFLRKSETQHDAA